MDPTSIALGIAVALQTMYTAFTQYKARTGEAKAAVDAVVVQERTDMATLIDSRIQVELTRQDSEIQKLKERVLQLETIEAEHTVAQLYMRANGLVWPPPTLEGV